MKGIQYIVDEKGRRTDIIISLTDHAPIIQDILNLLLAEEKKSVLNDLIKDQTDFNEEDQNNNLPKKPLKFGMMKGTFEVPDNFDEPLDDFKEYMP